MPPTHLTNGPADGTPNCRVLCQVRLPSTHCFDGGHWTQIFRMRRLASNSSCRRERGTSTPEDGRALQIWL